MTNKQFCGHCQVWKLPTEFYGNRVKANGRCSWCKTCSNKYKVEQTMKKKQELVDMLGGKCQKCNYDKCLSALEFHHDNPKTKVDSVSNILKHSFARATEEAKKCQLLCANCHAEETQKQKAGCIY